MDWRLIQNRNVGVRNTLRIHHFELLVRRSEHHPGWHPAITIATALNQDSRTTRRTLDTLLSQGKIHYRTSPLGCGEYSFEST